MALRSLRVVPFLLLLACENRGSTPAVAPPSAIGAASSTTSGAVVPPASASAPNALAAPPARVALTAPKSFPLPAGQGDAVLDYLAYEPARDRVWIPMARDIGTVDVFDVAKSTFTRIGGFPIAKKERNGRTRAMGPSSAGVGDGVVYIGNRGTNEICVVDATTLKLGKCQKTPVAPDAVVYVATSKEVWVTSPDAQTIVVYDASKPDAPAQKEVRKLDGAPEGFAVDDTRGIFYTNYEDKDRTVAIDIKTRAVKSNWAPACGEDGPRGLVVDPVRNLLVVACTDHVQVLDPKADGKNLAKLETGQGVDILDYSPATQLLYVAAGRAAKLTVAHLANDGSLEIVASAATAERARNAVVDKHGKAYLVDPGGARLLVFDAPK